MTRLLLICCALFFLFGCGDDVTINPAGPEPSPTPPPDHAALCEIRDSYIYVTKGDKQVSSWALGQTVTAHVRAIYAGQNDPQFDLAQCTTIDRVRWYSVAAAPILFLGDQSAPDIIVKIDHGGFHCFRAQPLSLTEPSEFCATVLAEEA